MKIVVPEPCLVVLVGPSGSGKSTFARHHFRPTEVLSSDFFRGMVSDDENDQSATKDAFDLLHAAAAKPLARRRFTVVNATNIKPEGRKQLLELARHYHDLTPDTPALPVSQSASGKGVSAFGAGSPE
jgi:protein phosphatase